MSIVACHNRRLCTSALLLAVLISACRADTEPNTTAGLDWSAMANVSKAKLALLDDPALASLLALSAGADAAPMAGRVPMSLLRSGGSALGAVIGPQPARAARGATGPSAARSILPRAPLRTSTGLHDPIPAMYYGRVFVRDAAGNWVVDSTRAGPAHGVRLMLYAFDSVTHTFSEQEKGYLDVLDSSSATATRATYRVVSGNATVFAFSERGRTVSDSVSGEETYSDSIAGTLTNGSRSLTFDASWYDSYVVADTASGSTIYDAHSTAPFLALELTLHHVDGALQAHQPPVTLTAVFEGKTLLFTTTSPEDSAGSYTGTDTIRVSVEGKPYATGVRPAAGPQVWTRSDGSPLPSSEASTLIEFFAGGVTDSFLYMLLSMMIGLWVSYVVV